MSKGETKCNDGVTKFFMDNIPCELMDWFREFSQKERRAISGQIIIAMEKFKKENEEQTEIIPKLK